MDRDYQRYYNTKKTGSQPPSGITLPNPYPAKKAPTTTGNVSVYSRDDTTGIWNARMATVHFAYKIGDANAILPWNITPKATS